MGHDKAGCHILTIRAAENGLFQQEIRKDRKGHGDARLSGARAAKPCHPHPSGAQHLPPSPGGRGIASGLRPPCRDSPRYSPPAVIRWRRFDAVDIFPGVEACLDDIAIGVELGPAVG
jgi:hypothetical protein